MVRISAALILGVSLVTAQSTTDNGLNSIINDITSQLAGASADPSAALSSIQQAAPTLAASASSVLASAGVTDAAGATSLLGAISAVASGATAAASAHAGTSDAYMSAVNGKVVVGALIAVFAGMWVM